MPPEDTLPSAKPAPCLSPSPLLTLQASPPSSASDCPPCSYPIPPWTAITAFLSRTSGVQAPQVLSLCIRTRERARMEAPPPSPQQTQIESQARYMLCLLFCTSRQGLSICANSCSHLPSKANLPRRSALGAQSMCGHISKSPLPLRRVLEATAL